MKYTHIHINPDEMPSSKFLGMEILIFETCGDKQHAGPMLKMLFNGLLTQSWHGHLRWNGMDTVAEFHQRMKTTYVSIVSFDMW